MGNVGLAILLTALAGLATCVGSLIALFPKAGNKKVLSFSLGFSAGVMIYVSFVELFKEANELLGNVHGEKTGLLFTILAFFVGMIVTGIIERIIPTKDENEQQPKTPEDKKKATLLRSGFLTACAVAIHNLPEGMATFVAAMQSMEIAIPVVIAVAIHNIPIGMSISAPVYYATNNKKKALLYAFLTSLVLPLGAILCYLLLMPYMNDTIYGLMYAFVAGVMIFVSIDELLPASREYGDSHLSTYGLIAGMIVMALCLWIFI